MESYKIEFATLPWEDPMPGVRCKTQRLDGRQLRLVTYTPDMPPHWCERGHIGLVLEGELELRFAQQTLVYHPGDGLFIPPGSVNRHMARALTDEVRVIFVEDV